MTKRLTRQQQQDLLEVLFEEACRLRATGASIREMDTSLRCLRDDLVQAYRQGIAVRAVQGPDPGENKHG